MALDPNAPVANEAAELAAEEAKRAAARARAVEINKYRAAAWDRAATAFLAGGFISPFITWMIGTRTLTLHDYFQMAFGIGICLVCALLLHFNGRDILEETFK
ncbi:hypothetical protein NKH72_21685 [Mesorhizobium sp. M0955]|uniref:hypothetical protein n=1 Tax=Mesorhizobium sp. M0955 TaxID=2957033 RepID=UPI00333B8573